MTKTEAITQLVPQPHNSIGEALLYAALITASAFVLHAALMRTRPYLAWFLRKRDTHRAKIRYLNTMERL